MAEEFPGLFTREGRFIQYNIYGINIEITCNYWPPIKPIGRGAYGIICSVYNTQTDKRVAIKKAEDVFCNLVLAKRTLREIKILRHFDHENIIALLDVVSPFLDEFSDVYFATELMGADLHQIIKSDQNLTDAHVKILRGLKYIHSADVIHGDLKPSSVLVSEKTDVKISDFSLTRPDSEEEMIDSATTWYRAPELLLLSYDYTSANDIWSIGCILMELMIRKPLFHGNDFVHHIQLITELLGTPTESDLQSLQNDMARRYMRQLPPKHRQPLIQAFPQLNPLAIDLVEKMLTFDPTRRISVEAALSHPYFEELHDVDNEPTCPEPFSLDLEQASLGVEEIKKMIYDEALIFNPDFA